MKNYIYLPIFVLLTACAHGKMGHVDQPLEKGALNKSQVIYVEPISTKGIRFSGDKAKDKAKTEQEKEIIEATFSDKIVEALTSKGFNAKRADDPVNTGIVITGSVTRFDHGSAAARILVGMGAGSTNMYTDFSIEDRDQGKTLAKFEIIGTSGGQGGFASSGSFMNTHLKNCAKEFVKYILKSN